MFIIVDKDGKIDKEASIVEVSSLPDKVTHYVDGEWLTIKEKDRDIVLKQLEDTNSQLVRVIEDLVKFCKPLGFVPDVKKRELIKERQELRQRLKDLG